MFANIIGLSMIGIFVFVAIVGWLDEIS